MSEGELYGLRVWITRPEAQAQPLIGRINAAGGQALAVPTLEIVPPAAAPQLPMRAQTVLARAHAVIFVSRNAVDWLWHWLGQEADPLCSDTTILAIGPATAAALNRYGIAGVLQPDTGADSEALLLLPALGQQLIRSCRVVIVRGEGGRELLADTLRQRGANIEYLEVYKRQSHADTRTRLPALWRDQPPDAIVASSPAGVMALLEMTGDAAMRAGLRACPLVCLGRNLPARARTLGFQRCYPVPVEAGDSAILTILHELQSRDRHE